jgi:acyl-CoA thioesterase-1
MIAPKLLIAALLLSFTIPGTAQEKSATNSAPKKVAAKKKAAPDPAFAKIEDDPSLPRVLLIGDSISIGYTVPVRELLKGKANVYRIPTNGGPTTNGLANLDKWLGTGKWDVIHFNWGLHDLKYLPDGSQMIPPAAYEKNMRELVKRLKATNAKLIWASTTPVPEGKLEPPRKPSDVSLYNAAAQRVMSENHIVTDDLYAFALPRLDKIQRPANVHYTNEGYKELSKAVVASIEKELPTRK